MQRSHHALLLQAQTIVKQHMSKYDTSHDWAHVNRVRNVAVKIGAELQGKVDMLVLELAALFHDMADAKYASTASLPVVLEPFYSSPIAIETLSISQVSLINRIIPAVSWTTESKLRKAGEWTDWHATCYELHAVQDADRLDAIGAVGIFRCSAFSGAKGRLLITNTEDGETNTAEQHFHDKLLNIKDRMKTNWGKAEAQRRQKTMLDFLQALQEEKTVWRSTVEVA